MFAAESPSARSGQAAEPAEMAEKRKLNAITESIIGAVIQVHHGLESAYEACLECGE